MLIFLKVASGNGAAAHYLIGIHPVFRINVRWTYLGRTAESCTYHFRRSHSPLTSSPLSKDKLYINEDLRASSFYFQQIIPRVSLTRNTSSRFAPILGRPATIRYPPETSSSNFPLSPACTVRVGAGQRRHSLTKAADRASAQTCDRRISGD